MTTLAGQIKVAALGDSKDEDVVEAQKKTIDAAMELVQEEAESKWIEDSLDEISWNGLFNFFANPEPSFRNIIMNTGFSAFQHILWLAPTFFWTGKKLPLPTGDRIDFDVDPFFKKRKGASIDADLDPFHKNADERIGSLIEYLDTSSPAAIYNRLFCPRCVAQNLGVFWLLVKYGRETVSITHSPFTVLREDLLVVVVHAPAGLQLLLRASRGRPGRQRGRRRAAKVIRRHFIHLEFIGRGDVQRHHADGAVENGAHRTRSKRVRHLTTINDRLKPASS